MFVKTDFCFLQDSIEHRKWISPGRKRYRARWPYDSEPRINTNEHQSAICLKRFLETRWSSADFHRSPFGQNSFCPKGEQGKTGSSEPFQKQPGFFHSCHFVFIRGSKLLLHRTDSGSTGTDLLRTSLIIAHSHLETVRFTDAASSPFEDALRSATCPRRE